MGKAAAARKLAAAAAYGGGGLSVLGAGALRRAERRGAAGPTRHRGRQRRAAARRHRLVRPRPARPGDQDRAARRLQRRRLRRRAGSRRPPARCWPAGSPERADRRVHLRAFAVVGAQLRRPRRPGRPGPADRARRRGDPDRRQRRHPSGPALGLGAPPLRGRAPAARRRACAVVVGTCPDLGTIKPIAPPLKQVARHLVAPAGRGPDDRRRRGRRPHRLAGLDPRTGVRRRAGPAVRPRPVPPLGRRLPLAGRGPACPRCSPRSAWPPRTRPRPRPAAARACCRSRRGRDPGGQHPGTELDGTEVGGRTRGVRGLWVELRHRRRQPQTEGEAPGEDEDEDERAGTGSA